MSEFYDLKGKEKSFLFGNTDIESRVFTKILFEPVSLAANRIVALGYQRAAVVCLESDFSRYGRAVKKIFCDAGLVSEIVALGEKASKEDFYALYGSKPFKGGIIIAVGDERLNNTAKIVAAEKGCGLAFIPLSCRLSDALTGRAEINGEKVGCARPNFLVLDPEFYSSDKKRYFAEAYGEGIAASLDLIDYKIAVLTGRTKFDKGVFTLLSEAANYALNIRKFESVAEGLVISQLKISLAKEYSSVTDFSSISKVAEVLGRVRDFTEGERKLRAFYALLPLYKLYLSSDEQVYGRESDAVKASGEVAEFISVPEYEAVLNIAPLGENAVEEAMAIRAVAKRAFLRDIDALISAIPSIEKNYAFLYSGKKRLYDFSPADMKKAIKAAAYFSEVGMLYLMRADGFSEFI